MNSIGHVGIYAARNYAVIAAVKLMLFELEQCALLDYALGVQVLLDGYWSKHWIQVFESECPGVKFRGIVNGDAKVYEISAASIVARVYIDALFEGYNRFWPGYHLSENHGSPDKRMYAKLKRSGPSPVFRTKHYGTSWWKRIMGKRWRNEGM